MKPVVIDSSVFVSLFVQKDVNHRKALNIWKNMRESGTMVLAPTLLLPEVCGVIARVTKDKRYADEVRKRMEKWLKMKVLTLKELTIERANWAAEASINFNLKGADAVFISLARELNLKFLTFDEEVRKKVKNEVKFL